MNPSDNQVVIVGAGAAGIGAARTLIAAGISPIVLEARNRIGGRVLGQVLHQNLLSVNERSSSTVTVQLGANWIHNLDDCNPLYSTIKQMQLSLHSTSSDSEPGDDIILFDSSYRTPQGTYSNVDSLVYQNACKRYEWISEHFEDKVGQNKLLSEGFEAMLKMSVNVFGPIPDTERHCLNWFFDRIAIDLATPLCFAATDNFLEPDTAGCNGEALIEGGYSQVIDHLAAETLIDIRLNHEVVSVHCTSMTESKQNIRVECSNKEIFNCKFCIVTLPIGVLHSGDVVFQPSVPQQISRLCSEVVPGLMNIVWLWYPHEFWPTNYNFIGITHDISEVVEFGTFLIPPMKDQFGKQQPILMCQLVGDFAVASESLSESEVASRATEVLRKVFGVSHVPNAIGCLKSAWKSDKFARGSWAHVPYKPSTDNETERLNHDVNNSDSCKAIDSCVFYAGEASNYDHRGTVHGAYMSGVEEAKKIIEKLCYV